VALQRWPKFNHPEKTNVRLKNGCSHYGLAWLVVHGVYCACIIWWSYCLGPMCHTHIHGKGEREASMSLHLASCMDAIGQAHRAHGQLMFEGGEQGEDHNEREEQGVLKGCSPCPTMTVELGSCVWPYTLYARQSEAKAGEQVSELSVLLGGGGEHLGLPFYRPRKRGYATSLLTCLQLRCCGRMVEWWSDDTASLVIVPGMQMDGPTCKWTVAHSVMVGMHRSMSVCMLLGPCLFCMHA
jgi:hypothetical protein